MGKDDDIPKRQQGDQVLVLRAMGRIILFVLEKHRRCSPRIQLKSTILGRFFVEYDRVFLFQYDPFIDDAFLDVFLGGDLVHKVEHYILHDRAKPARPRSPLDGELGDGRQRAVGEAELDLLEIEQLLILLDEGVFRQRQDLYKRLLREVGQRGDYRKPSHEFGDKAVLNQVLGLHLGQCRPDIHFLLLLDIGAEPEGLGVEPPLDDLFQARERAAADEEDIGGVDREELLLGVFSPALGRHIGDRPLDDLEEGLLDPLSGYVPGD